MGSSRHFVRRFGLVVDAVRRAEQERLHAQRAVQQALGDVQLHVNLRARDFVPARMRVGVVADLVAFGIFAPDHSQRIVGAAADHEKSGRRFFRLQNIQNFRRELSCPGRRRNSARSCRAPRPSGRCDRKTAATRNCPRRCCRSRHRSGSSACPFAACPRTARYRRRLRESGRSPGGMSSSFARSASSGRAISQIDQTEGSSEPSRQIAVPCTPTRSAARNSLYAVTPSSIHTR